MAGKISGVIDSLVFEEIRCEGVELDSVHISGDIWALVYSGLGFDGFLCTFSINSAGQISDTVIDSREHDTERGMYSQITHISGTVYAIIYTYKYDISHTRTVRAKTINIATDGTIGAEIATKDIYISTSGKYNRLFSLGGSSNIYGIVHMGDDGDGFINTIKINDDGSIDNVLDTYKFDTIYCMAPDIIHLAGTVYAIVYSGAVFDEGLIATVNIADNGTITHSTIDNENFDVRGFRPKIIRVSETVCAIVYGGVSWRAMLKTWSIADDGTIGAVIDTYELYNHTAETYPDIIRLEGKNIFIIAYNSTVGQVVTVEIANDGTITIPYLDILPNFETNVTLSHLFEIGDVFAVAHRGRDSDGFIETFKVGQEGASSALQLFAKKLGV